MKHDNMIGFLSLSLSLSLLLSLCACVCVCGRARARNLKRNLIAENLNRKECLAPPLR